MNEETEMERFTLHYFAVCMCNLCGLEKNPTQNISENPRMNWDMKI